MQPESRLAEVVSFVEVGSERPFGLPLQGEVGDSVSEPPRPRRLRVARRARELHHRARLRLRGRPALSRVLGSPRRRARARHRKGHPPVPRGVLAGVPHVGGPAAADDRPGARLVAARREEGVQVRRQHRPARPARGRLRPRCAAVLPDARDGLRAGRVVLGRGVPDPLQRGSRERPRQHRLARRGSLPAVLRQDAQRGLRRQRRHARLQLGPGRVAGGHGRLPVQPGARGGLEISGRDQRIRRDAGAVEDPEGRRGRFRPPPPRALGGRRGRAAFGRDALAFHSGDEPEDLRGLRHGGAATRPPPTSTWGRLPVSQPMPEMPALFPRATRRPTSRRKT